MDRHALFAVSFPRRALGDEVNLVARLRQRHALPVKDTVIIR
jgi:hypothetical protein